MNNLKKIYDIEVTPPTGAWNHIARELDNLEQEQRLATQLGNVSVTPPEWIWAGIAEELDVAAAEENLRKKLYPIEAEVPPMMWTAIAGELDDQKALEIIEHKLAHIQVRPPGTAWANIVNELEGKAKSPSLVVPMHYGWLKYAAAACFIAIISISAFFILSENNGSNTIADTGVANNSKNALPGGAANYNASNRQQQALNGVRTRLGNAYSASNEKNADLQNRYIILMTEDGNIVRMSKKVSNMADCIAGEDRSCDEQISKWQKEMASSNAAASPDNFLDILDMASNDATETSQGPKM